MDNENKSCDEITGDLLADYADGTLEDEFRRKIEKHLEGCDFCRARAQDIRIITGALREDPQLSEDIPVPESVDRAVLGTIREVAGKQRVRSSWLLQKRFWVISSAAACVLLVVIIGLLLATGRSSQYADREAMNMQKEGKYGDELEEDSGIRARRTIKGIKERNDTTAGDSKVAELVAEKAAQPPTVEFEESVGDIDGDRVVDVADALSICRQILEGRAMDYQHQKDANGDGRIDVGDALHIINKALKEQG
jgi:hypothetical protein